jgi:RimJ/RimL family protein N-acetyltransferase
LDGIPDVDFLALSREGGSTMIHRVVDGQNTATTERLLVRRPSPTDRSRFIELFCDDEFMAFSSGVLTEEQADARFEGMLARCAELRLAKQPVVERSSGVVVGYTGVEWIELEGDRWLEWGNRLVPPARGKGYATESSAALVHVATEEHKGDILGIIHPDHVPSRRVIRNLGFEYWRRGLVQGELQDLYRLEI